MNRICLMLNQTQLTTVLFFMKIVILFLHWLIWVVSVDAIYVFQSLLTIAGTFLQLIQDFCVMHSLN